MTMAAPYWVFVAVVVLMTVRNGETVIDPNNLAPIVEEILNRYTPNYNGANNNRIPPMFSVAVSVPYNEDKFDDGEAVRRKILNCDVYKSDRVVAATVLRWPNVLTQCPDAQVQWDDVLKECGKQQMTWAEVESLCGANTIKDGRADHAEFRTLQYVNTLVKSQNDLIVFYVRASPCDQRCTNEDNRWNILTKIQDIMKWKDYVVVFSDVFRPRNGGPIPVNNLRGSLERLGNAIADPGSNGLQHIFRCYRQQKMKCFSCNDNGAVTDECVSDGKQPDSKLSDVGKSQDRGKKQNKSKKKQRSNRQRGGVMRENHQN
ncbi:uncharacterized protein LOC116319576 [Oreochromis aureus]|uniref:uncharacterized protein LOC116319576 n=1 Tax=Oreochromis aureus TaxID=47969 RepID=UPI0019542B54|nr:uncharacterized protein LOC116319576 [Oreochromis aureus]